MEKIKLHIDQHPFKAKPKGKAPGAINNRITNEVAEVTPSEMAQLIGNEGRTVVLATMNGKRAKANMIQQQALMLDFDNKDEETGKKTEGIFYQTIEETLQDPFITQYASFMYKTFNHKEDWEKFRVAFILDQPLTSNEEVAGAYQYLMDKFPNADKSTKDSSRLFYGGTEAIEVNFNNILPKSSLPTAEKKTDLKLLKPTSLKVAQTAKANQTSSDKPTWELIKSGEYEEVKERLKPFSYRVHSMAQAMNYIKTLPMGEILTLPANRPFIDLFHDEKNPSAGIYETEYGTWMYKCHSSGNPYDGDVLKVVGTLTGKGYIGALKLLVEWMGISIEETDQIKELRASWGLIQGILMSDDLKKNFPDVHNRFWRYKTDINALIDIFKENIYEDMDTGELRTLTYMSTRRLSEKLYGTKNKHYKIVKIINLMDYTNWISKLDEKDIPVNLMKKLREIQELEAKKNGAPRRRNNVIELLRHEDENYFFEQLNKKCEVMEEEGFTMDTLNREGILAKDGKDKANSLFVQDQNRGISKKTATFYDDMVKLITFHLQNEPYVSQNEVIDSLAVKWSSGRKQAERQYKKLLPKLLKEKGIEKSRLKKEHREKWGLPSAQSSPTILYKAQ